MDPTDILERMCAELPGARIAFEVSTDPISARALGRYRVFRVRCEACDSQWTHVVSDNDMLTEDSADLIARAFFALRDAFAAHECAGWPVRAAEMRREALLGDVFGGSDIGALTPGLVSITEPVHPTEAGHVAFAVANMVRAADALSVKANGNTVDLRCLRCGWHANVSRFVVRGDEDDPDYRIDEMSIDDWIGEAVFQWDLHEEARLLRGAKAVGWSMPLADGSYTKPNGIELVMTLAQTTGRAAPKRPPGTPTGVGYGEVDFSRVLVHPRQDVHEALREAFGEQALGAWDAVLQERGIVVVDHALIDAVGRSVVLGSDGTFVDEVWWDDETERFVVDAAAAERLYRTEPRPVVCPSAARRQLVACKDTTHTTPYVQALGCPTCEAETPF